MPFQTFLEGYSPPPLPPSSAYLVPPPMATFQFHKSQFWLHMHLVKGSGIKPVQYGRVVIFLTYLV